MKFSNTSGPPVPGELKYINSEHSFLFQVSDRRVLRERAGQDGVTSLTLDTLQIDVGIAHRTLLYAWGFFPRGNWIATSLKAPIPMDGIVTVSSQLELSVGISRPLLEENTSYETFFDAEQGLVLLKLGGATCATYTRVAEGFTVGIDDHGNMEEVWLSPTFEP